MPPALHQEGGYIFEGRQAPGRDFCYYLFHIESLRNFATPSLGAKVHISAMEFEKKIGVHNIFHPFAPVLSHFVEVHYLFHKRTH